MKTTLSLVATALLVAASAAQAADKPHWGYQGHGSPAHWAELDAEFKTCKLGQLQSPINIVTKKVEKAAEAKPIGFAYTAGTGGEVVDNGHTIQVNLPSSGAVTLDGTEYKLLQFHFHTPSEESFDGQTLLARTHRTVDADFEFSSSNDGDDTGVARWQSARW